MAVSSHPWSAERIFRIAFGAIVVPFFGGLSTMFVLVLVDQAQGAGSATVARVWGAPVRIQRFTGSLPAR